VRCSKARKNQKWFSANRALSGSISTVLAKMMLWKTQRMSGSASGAFVSRIETEIIVGSLAEPRPNCVISETHPAPRELSGVETHPLELLIPFRGP
jgi:hypothetical protein